MNTRLQIDLAEMRDVRDEHELFFVEATETAEGWQFREKSTWEQRWHAVLSSPRLVTMAQYGKSAIRAGIFRTGGVYYSTVVEDGACSEFQVCEAAPFPVQTRGCVQRVTTVLARFRFEGFRVLLAEGAGEEAA
jgi:hypothetical protein